MADTHVLCGKCGTTNWATRTTCRQCKASLPKALGTVASFRTIHKGGRRAGNSAWDKQPAIPGLAPTDKANKDERIPSQSAAAAGQAAKPPEPPVGDDAGDTAKIKQNRAERITMLQETIDRFVAQGFERSHLCISTLHDEAEALRKQRDDAKPPDLALKDLQRKLTAKEKQRDSKTEAIKQQEDEIAALKEALEENKKQLDTIIAEVTALEEGKDTATSKAQAAKLADMEPAQAITDVLGLVGRKVDKNNPQAAAKLEELSQQIAAAATQIAGLPQVQEEETPPADSATPAAGAGVRRVRRNAKDGADDPADTEMVDAEAFAAEAAASARKDAEKRAVQEGLDPDMVAKVLGIVATAEDDNKRRRCK